MSVIAFMPNSQFTTGYYLILILDLILQNRNFGCRHVNSMMQAAPFLQLNCCYAREHQLGYNSLDIRLLSLLLFNFANGGW